MKYVYAFEEGGRDQYLLAQGVAEMTAPAARTAWFHHHDQA
jgi:hypothetical protein